MRRDEKLDCPDSTRTGESVNSINRRWKHRRQLAYMAFASIVGLTAWSMLVPATAVTLTGIVGTVIAGMFSVLLAYTGAATFDDVSARRDASQREASRYRGPEFGEMDPEDGFHEVRDPRVDS